MSEQHIAHLRSFRQVVTSKRDALDGLIAEIDQALQKYDQDSKPWFMKYIAVTGRGHFGGESKIHAADPETGEKPDHGTPYRGSLYYTSRCGRRYMFQASSPPGPFDKILHLEQCQRCVKLLAKDHDRWVESQQGKLK